MMKICKFFYTLIFCCLAFRAYSAEIGISLDKSVISEGDTLYLTISYDGKKNDKPDLSSLKKDFDIVSQSYAEQYNMINGSVSQTKKWTIGLIPLKTGKISIAPIRYGNLISNDVEVEVKKVTDVAYVPDSEENSNAPYFQIEQTIDTPSPYVQQQVILITKVYDSIGLHDGSITISDESKKDWIIIPLLDKPFVKQDVVNNKHVNVITFAFAAFAQKSGKIKTPEISFNGYYLKNANFDFPNFDDDLMMFGVDFRNAFGQKVPVRMRSKTEEINVKPAPTSLNSATWLPLTGLTISARWAPGTQFIKGEALSRTLTFTASGMTESLLPQFSFPQAEGFKQYPEKPSVMEKIVDGQLVTTATMNIVYIPIKSGELTIPPFEIEWFNVRTGQFEKAVLAEEKLNISPAFDTDTSSVIDLEKDTSTVGTKKTDNIQPKKEETALGKINDFTGQLNKKILIMAIVGFLIFVIILKLWFTQKNKHKQRDLVITLIKNHNYKGAKEALIRWGEQKFLCDDIKNFNQLSSLVNNDEFSAELAALNKFLYSDDGGIFDGVKFIEIFKKIDKMKKKQQKNCDVLPKLYD
ncbi:MAG: BatD family protein [Alphaproteobacteria bacterium]|nr:BatD family protein [Alphaproteobacteria bacterium]MBP3687908.1 BatD family protein [Alphaproteobacteria bacterium]